MDRLTPEQRHKNMVAVRSKGTTIETTLGKMLWHAGVRYRKNDKSVMGHPDFTVKKKKVAIFCDGDMWHGRNWDVQQTDFKSHREFWIPKIERNIQRDKEVNAALQEDGWMVLRFWESDIRKHPEICVAECMKYLQ